ncbi:MAG TPA: imelysin family protein [Polyangiales bacterium]|nr:imelysin family protein [Polyangiales bacterium]
MGRGALSIVVVLGGLLGACGSRGASDVEIAARSRAALHTYAEIAAAAYADSVSGSHTLAKAVDHLLAAPSEESLSAARDAWLQARVPYAQTEVFRFYDGPIDAVERTVNSWPIDENYVESDASGQLGLIEDSARYPVLSGALLAQLNMTEGETSVSTGYHVVEFLLWGRDTNPDGPGQRSFRDFVDPGAAGAVARRRSYLQNATGLLVQQLEQVARAWTGDYRARFLALPPRQALGLAIKGMGSLSGPELSGERLSVAYETKDQENEHSCFSDSTLADLTGDALGLQNVCLGRYRRVDGSSVQGTGICAALQLMAAPQAARLEAQTAAGVAALRAIPGPFDRAILGSDSAPGRKAVAAAIQALREQSDTLAEIAQALQVGLTP